MSKRLFSEGYFSASNIEKMFALDVSKTAFLNYEEKGLIPTAERLMRGKSAYRAWNVASLPLIGQSIGYLKRPKQTKTIAVFSLKGGTGKTTFAFQLARTLALHNIRTLVIGLDAQESITQTLNRTITKDHGQDDLDGLYQILSKEKPAEACVVSTDLPTLNYIPETIELSVLDRFLKNKVRKEYIIREKLVEPLMKTGKIDIIIFDCNPAWTDTVTGALASTDILISPLGCDINSLKAANIFVDLLAEFQDEMRHDFERFFIVPTLAETNKLSQQILSKYILEFQDLCTTGSIRRSVTAQEANVVGKSLLEMAFASPIYQDFLQIFKEINSIFVDEPQNQSDERRLPLQTPKLVERGGSVTNGA